MKTTKSIMMLVLWSLLLVGCNGYQTVSLDSSQKNVLKGKTVTYVHKKHPVRPLTHHSASGTSVMSAIASGVSTSISTEKAKREGGVVYGKPSEVLSKKIIAFLSKTYRMKSINNRFAPIGTEQIPKYSLYNSDYILDINTHWIISQIQFFGNDVILNNNIKLVNTKTQKIAFQYSCSYESMLDSGLEKSLYSQQDLLALNGKSLKYVTSRAINLCLEEIKAKVLK
ncbi:MAG: hypothetical protein KAI79_15235 [Bacteroidales bacterium]|nr:hypothetical protein [Bacteroidales bacterium]